SPRCPGRRAACRAPSGGGSGTRRGCARRPPRTRASPVRSGACSLRSCSCSCVLPRPLRQSTSQELPARQAREDELAHLRAEALVADPLDDLAREREGEQVAALVLADPPRAEVEEGGLVELPDRRAVRALHVVREDLELRLRVHERIAREEQVTVGLARI